MPALDSVDAPKLEPKPLMRLPFKAVTRQHILHCSYEYWHTKYRSSTLKSRIIPLSPAFLSYLREDGIILPSSTSTTFSDPCNNTSTTDDWDEDPVIDPSLQFLEIHREIQDTIYELGGLVVPKLNWSSPKDATWISMTKNSMECATPNDIYLLLKSSDFITHDLEHAFDDCAEDESLRQEDIQYVLILKKWFKRDLNHFNFLFQLRDRLQEVILEYFEKTLKNTFPDQDFVFDVYLPAPYEKVRLMDINPWAPRTDPLLFSWLELLTLQLPAPLLGMPDSSECAPLPVSSSDEDTQDEDEIEMVWRPEFRLVKKDDPEAFSFSTPQYSAHKLPKDVVDASLNGESGMREFADHWRRMLDGGVEMQRLEDGLEEVTFE